MKKLSEYEEQCCLIEWARFNEGAYPKLKLLYAIPNGLKLTIGQAVKAKKQGLKKGIPDLCLPVKSKNYSGLYIEMKVNNNKTSPEQNWYLNALTEEGYKTAVCYSCKEAVDLIKEYLK